MIICVTELVISFLTPLANEGKKQCFPNYRITDAKLRFAGQVQNIFHITFILVELFHSLIRILINLMEDC